MGGEHLTACATRPPIFTIIGPIVGAKGDWDFWISDLAENPDGIDINPCGEFRRSPEGPFSQIHFPHLHIAAPGIVSDLLRSVQMLKRELGAESNGKLPHLFIPSKTRTLVPKFAIGQNYNLGSCVCSEKPGHGQNTLMMMTFLKLKVCTEMHHNFL